MTFRGAPRAFTGWHMLAIMIGFFGFVIVVNVAMARLALATFSGEVVENSYAASQNFNRWLDNAHAESALGWTAQVTPGPRQLRVDLRDERGQPIARARLGGHATHPLGARTDLVLTFVESAPGIYTAGLPAGRWQIALLAQARGHDWHHNAQVTAP